MSKTNDLHGKQFALWGWHDMRRKSADQKTSPCRINVKGRCDRLDCCCHGQTNPSTPNRAKPKILMSHKQANVAATVAALTTIDPRDAPGCKPTERRRVDEARAVETGLTTQLDVHAERRHPTPPHAQHEGSTEHDTSGFFAAKRPALLGRCRPWPRLKLMDGTAGDNSRLFW